jgi:LPXTG-motif cell wall-anchored protein
MGVNARRTAAVAIGTVLLSGPVAAVAYAATPYPPTSPSPTVSGVEVSQTATGPGGEVQHAASLPRTGTDVALWVIAAAALVASGAGLVVGSRRRSH